MRFVDTDAAAFEHPFSAAQQGDVAEFNQLVHIYQRQVYNVCFRTLGHAEDAADATQDAFLGAFRGLRTFRGPATGFRPWLLRVAVNACYDQLRRRQRRPADSLDALGDAPDELSPADRLPDTQAGPEQQALSGEAARLIQQAID